MLEFTSLNMQTILIAIVVGLLVLFAYKRSKYRMPPGPWCLPLIGNYEVYSSPYLHRKIAKLADKFGPVVRLSIGPRTWITLNNIEVAMEALVKQKADFAGRPFVDSFNTVTDGGKDIAIANYSPTWKYHRKIAGKALREYLKGDLLENLLNENVKTFMDSMAAESKPFAVKEYLDNIIFYQLYVICFGEKKSANDPEIDHLKEIINDFNKAQGNGFFEDIMPLMKEIFPTSRWREFHRKNDEVKVFITKKFNEHKDSFDTGIHRDFIDSLLMARAEAESVGDEDAMEKLDDTYLIQTIRDIFLAGTDTSRLTLDWFVCFMSGLPEIQKQCQEEIDHHIGSRLPTMSDREKVPFTEACLYETMRLGTIAGLGLPHATICDTQVGGYDVPKGTTVAINYWALHHDKNQWKDVDKFDPNRYLDDNKKLFAKPESWLPFSAGRRNCLGEPLAKAELLLICIHLLQRFSIILPEGVRPCFDGVCDYSLAIESPREYKIIVKERT